MSAVLKYNAATPQSTGWECPHTPTNDNACLHLVDATTSGTRPNHSRSPALFPPDRRRRPHAYDAAGQMTAYQKGVATGSDCLSPSGNDMVTLGYDVLGQLTTTDYADPATPDITRSYDANGNVKTVNRGAGADLVRWTYYYNAINLLTHEYLDMDGRDYDLRYYYNNDGYMTSSYLPSGRNLNYSNDGLGRMVGVSSGGTSYASGISYHPSGAIAGMTYGNGQVFSQTLTARQQPLRMLSQAGTSKALDLTYTYDVRGKVTNILNGAITGDDRTYGYDALGNIRTKTEGGRALVMSYDSKNRLVSHTDTGGPNRTLGYDSRGNVTQLGGLFFSYDRSDQPTYISGTASGTYRYDGNMKRVKSIVDGKTIYNVYNKSGTLVHIDQVTDGKATDYVGKFVRIENNTPTYLHMDHLGSANTGTSQNGTVAWREQYMPFGSTMTNPLGNADLAGYTGHIKDSATGLNYMQARYYDPLIGRFLSIDPINFSPDAPYMFNRYTYVNNDPVNMIDPDGEFGIFGAVLGAGIGALIETGTQLYKNGGDLGSLDGGAIFKSAVIGGAVGATGGLAGAVVTKGVTLARGAQGATQVLSTTGGAVTQGAIIGAAGTAAGETTSQLIENGGNLSDLDGGAIVKAAGIGAMTGGVGGALGAQAQKKLQSAGYRKSTVSDLMGGSRGISGGTGNPKIATNAANLLQSTGAATGRAINQRSSNENEQIIP